MSYDQSKVAFVDIETTGLDPQNHRVWEIAVIVDGVEYVWQQRLTNTGPWSDQDAMLQHLVNVGIVDQYVLDHFDLRARYRHEEALHVHQSLDKFVHLVGDRHIVGACPWFDSERLFRDLLSTGYQPRRMPWHYHLIDVENLVVGYIAGLQGNDWDLVWHEGRIVGKQLRTQWGTWTPELPWSSDMLSRAVGVNPDDYQPKHSALADARWAKAMYEAVIGRPS